MSAARLIVEVVNKLDTLLSYPSLPKEQNEEDKWISIEMLFNSSNCDSIACRIEYDQLTAVDCFFSLQVEPFAASV